MALISTQTISQAGLSPAFQAASAGGDSYQPGNNVFLAAKNASGSQITINVVTTALAYGQPISNVAVPVPAGAEVWFGPFDPGEVAQPGSNLASLTYSAASGLSVAAIECPSA